MRKSKPKKLSVKKYREFYIPLAFILAALIVALLIKSNKPERSDAEKITETFLSNGKVIDGQKLQKIQKMDYSEIKKSINAKDDFCMYLEDDKGNVILAKGSSSLAEDGINCK